MGFNLFLQMVEFHLLHDDFLFVATSCVIFQIFFHLIEFRRYIVEFFQPLMYRRFPALFFFGLLHKTDDII